MALKEPLLILWGCTRILSAVGSTRPLRPLRLPPALSAVSSFSRGSSRARVISVLRSWTRGNTLNAATNHTFLSSVKKAARPSLTSLCELNESVKDQRRGIDCKWIRWIIRHFLFSIILKLKGLYNNFKLILWLILTFSKPFFLYFFPVCSWKLFVKFKCHKTIWDLSLTCV